MISSIDSQTARTSQRNDVLRMPVINLNQTNQNEIRTKSNIYNVNDQRRNQTNNSYGRTKSALVDSSTQSFQYPRNSLTSDNDDQIEHEHRSKQTKTDTTPRNAGEYNSSPSELDNTNDEGDENENESSQRKRRPSLLNDNTRRLLVLGTIRPSKTFYKNLPQADVDHLMDYFRRMKNTQQRINSEDINQELANKYVEYKPKICKLFDRNYRM